ncbi:MAG: KEOPS complex subunit Pcc1 [Candidatus Thermoplasmatota archaeon]|nr:KEOPS complex subunit Pcc1 [Candidatus Thermoplasmatota archaeon]
MKVTCRLTLQFQTPEQGKNVFESVHIDDTSFMNTTISNTSMETRIQTRSISSMIHTLDDLLSCVQIAENVIKKTYTQNNKKTNQ